MNQIQIIQLESRMRILEEKVDELYKNEFTTILIVKMTEELFEDGKITIETLDSNLVFNVSCNGSLKGLLEKEKEWNQRVQRIEPKFYNKLRLVVCPN